MNEGRAGELLSDCDRKCRYYTSNKIILLLVTVVIIIMQRPLMSRCRSCGYSRSNVVGGAGVRAKGE